MAKVLDDINFFGAVDRKGKRKDGNVTSEYPAFYFHTQYDELKEETEKQERQLKMGIIPPSEVPYITKEIERNKERLIDIQKSKPQLKGPQKDAVHKMYKELADQISDSMFTRSEMKKGLGDAHEEARRMSQPIISIAGNQKFFSNMGITAKNGKITRNQAARAYKIMGKALGENTNTERLRKDRKTGTHQIERTLHEMLNG